MTEFFTAEDGARIAYLDEGHGLPVLALSGLTRTMHDFDYLKPHLPETTRLIRMDYRGRGQSDRTGADSYTVAQEGRDALALLDHLGVDKAAVLGTSRGGLIGMVLAGVAHERLLGLALVDVGPQLERAGLERIFGYLGRNPSARTHAEVAARLPVLNPGFEDVPDSRWLEEARLHWRETADGLEITYDPALREAFMGAFEGEQPDLWPLFDRAADLPLCLIRGANSDLLSSASADEMRRRRPDMIYVEVAGRAHIPFLDETQAIEAINGWIAACRTEAAM